MERKFSPGDIVQLKSGGPAMTVSKIHSDPVSGGGYHCEWFRGASKERAFFQEEAIKKYVAPSKE